MALHYKPDQIRTNNMISSRSTDLHFTEEDYDTSPTEQHHLDSTDINKILQNNPLLREMTMEEYYRQPFEDYGDSTDYHSALNYLQEASNSFMSLDATIRARFQNDPGAFLDFVNDPKNGPELVEMGLATERPQKPTKTAPIEPQPPLDLPPKVKKYKQVLVEDND